MEKEIESVETVEVEPEIVEVAHMSEPLKKKRNYPVGETKPARQRQYPTKHNSKSMTEKQEVFAKNLAAGKNATEAVIIAYGDEVRYPSQFGHTLRNKPQIQKYMMDTAQECAEIQMEMIINKKTPAAVRNDAIKDRLNRAGVKADEDVVPEQNLSIGNIVINVVN